MNIHSVPTATPARSTSATAILDAATAVFAKRGFFGAQVADVARGAGIAAGTVYLYFRSKDEILTSIFDRTMQRGDRRRTRGARRRRTIPSSGCGGSRTCTSPGMGRDRNLAIVFQVELRQTTKFMERFSDDRACATTWR